MARKKQTAKEQAQGLGCLVVIGLAVVVYASSNRGGASSPTLGVTNDPIMLTRERIPDYGVRVDVEQDFVIAQANVDLHNCPQFGCDVVGTAVAGERLELVGMIAGEPLNDFDGWFEIENDKRPLYAHLHMVMPMDATAQANRTPSPTFDTPTPTVNAPNYGSRIDTAEEWVSLPNDVDFRSCPLLSCDVVREAQKDERVLGVGFVSGEIANDISFDMWAIVRFGDVELFAPMSDVFPPEDGE